MGLLADCFEVALLCSMGGDRTQRPSSAWHLMPSFLRKGKVMHGLYTLVSCLPYALIFAEERVTGLFFIFLFRLPHQI
jgi:hypothetical protein